MNDTLILVPTYNNAGTLKNVLQRCLEQGLSVLVVDDGSTDDTGRILKEIPGQAGYDGLMVLTHPVNQGKGRALKTGFQEALRLGYPYVITLDADRQHHPEDVPLLLAQKGEKTLVVGSRSIRGKDGGSSFANKFSNFWFTLYTWIKLPDTQTGYRLYPLRELPSLRLLSARYEAELTLLVFSGASAGAGGVSRRPGDAFPSGKGFYAHLHFEHPAAVRCPVIRLSPDTFPQNRPFFPENLVAL